jgi:hypothetical protein
MKPAGLLLLPVPTTTVRAPAAIAPPEVASKRFGPHIVGSPRVSPSHVQRIADAMRVSEPGDPQGRSSGRDAKRIARVEKPRFPTLLLFIQEYTMKVKKLFALSALALATGAVMAQQGADQPVTRAEVVQSVLAARANGTLAHTGSVAPEEEMEYARTHPSTSPFTRAQESRSVLQARAAGQLAHTGSVAPEEEMEFAQAHPSTSTLTRADVKEEVLEARADGTLIPAGQGEFAGVTRAYAPTAFAAKASPKTGPTLASSATK